MASPKDDDGQEFIFRASITLPDGTTIYAKTYGWRAFKIPVKG